MKALLQQVYCEWESPWGNSVSHSKSSSTESIAADFHHLLDKFSLKRIVF